MPNFTFILTCGRDWHPPSVSCLCPDSRGSFVHWPAETQPWCLSLGLLICARSSPFLPLQLANALSFTGVWTFIKKTCNYQNDEWVVCPPVQLIVSVSVFFVMSCSWTTLHVRPSQNGHSKRNWLWLSRNTSLWDLTDHHIADGSNGSKQDVLKTTTELPVELSSLLVTQIAWAHLGAVSTAF